MSRAVTTVAQHHYHLTVRFMHGTAATLLWDHHHPPSPRPLNISDAEYPMPTGGTTNQRACCAGSPLPTDVGAARSHPQDLYGLANTACSSSGCLPGALCVPSLHCPLNYFRCAGHPPPPWLAAQDLPHRARVNTRTTGIPYASGSSQPQLTTTTFCNLPSPDLLPNHSSWVSDSGLSPLPTYRIGTSRLGHSCLHLWPHCPLPRRVLVSLLLPSSPLPLRTLLAIFHLLFPRRLRAFGTAHTRRALSLHGTDGSRTALAPVDMGIHRCPHHLPSFSPPRLLCENAALCPPRLTPFLTGGDTFCLFIVSIYL